MVHVSCELTAFLSGLTQSPGRRMKLGVLRQEKATNWLNPRYLTNALTMLPRKDPSTNGT
jgi:hypothetical protein